MTRKKKAVGRSGKAKPLSQRGYAEHRGCSLSTVQKAIRDGRLDESITRDARGHAKISDVELADAEWERYTRARNPAPELEDDPELEDVAAELGPEYGITYNEARRRKEVELWLHARVRREVDAIELDLKRGTVLTADDIEARIIDVFTSVKTKLLGAPSRARQLDPGLSADQIQLFEDLIREALEDLAE